MKRIKKEPLILRVYLINGSFVTGLFFIQLYTSIISVYF